MAVRITIVIGLLFLLALELSIAMKAPPDCVDVEEVCNIKGPDTTFKDECGRMVQCVGSETYYKLKKFGIRRNLTDEPVWIDLMSRFHRASPKRSREACSASVQYLYNKKRKAYDRLCKNKNKELYAKDES